MFNVHAATGAEMMGDLIEVVTRELKRSVEERPEAGEVERAKAQLKAGLLISLESSSARAEQMARQLLVHGRLLSPRELIDRVDAVTPEEIRVFAEGMVRGSKPSVTVVGAGKKSRSWAELTDQRMAG